MAKGLWMNIEGPFQPKPFHQQNPVTLGIHWNTDMLQNRMQLDVIEYNQSFAILYSAKTFSY